MSGWTHWYLNVVLACAIRCLCMAYQTVSSLDVAVCVEPFAGPLHLSGVLGPRVPWGCMRDVCMWLPLVWFYYSCVQGFGVRLDPLVPDGALQ